MQRERERPVIRMWTDGGVRKGRQLQRARTTGLAGLLDEERNSGKGVVVAAAAVCMHDDCSRWGGVDRTLAHVLDVSPPHSPEISFITDDKIDLLKVRSFLNAQLDADRKSVV